MEFVAEAVSVYLYSVPVHIFSTSSDRLQIVFVPWNEEDAQHFLIYSNLSFNCKKLSLVDQVRILL